MSRWGITASCWHGVTTWHVLTISLHDITSRSAVADRCRLLLMSGCLLSLSVQCKDLSPNLSRPLCSPQGVCVVVDLFLLISRSLHVVVSLHSCWCGSLLRVIHHCGSKWGQAQYCVERSMHPRLSQALLVFYILSRLCTVCFLQIWACVCCANLGEVAPHGLLAFHTCFGLVGAVPLAIAVCFPPSCWAATKSCHAASWWWWWWWWLRQLSCKQGTCVGTRCAFSAPALSWGLQWHAAWMLVAQTCPVANESADRRHELQWYRVPRYMHQLLPVWVCGSMHIGHSIINMMGLYMCFQLCCVLQQLVCNRM